MEKNKLRPELFQRTDKQTSEVSGDACQVFWGCCCFRVRRERVQQEMFPLSHSHSHTLSLSHSLSLSLPCAFFPTDYNSRMCPPLLLRTSTLLVCLLQRTFLHSLSLSFSLTHTHSPTQSVFLVFYYPCILSHAHTHGHTHFLTHMEEMGCQNSSASMETMKRSSNTINWAESRSFAKL